jgi:hypothetical protein
MNKVAGTSGAFIDIWVFHINEFLIFSVIYGNPEPGSLEWLRASAASVGVPLVFQKHYVSVGKVQA